MEKTEAISADSTIEETKAEDNAPKPAKSKKSQSLGKDATLLTISKVAVSAMAMVIAMLLSRFRTTEEVGIYNALIMIINLVVSLLTLGLPKSLNYFLARAETKEERQRFLSVYYTFNTILCIVIAVVLCGSSMFLARLFKSGFTLKAASSSNVFAKALNTAVEFVYKFKFTKYLFFLAIFPWTKIVMSSVENLLIVYRKAHWLIYYRISNSVLLVLSIIFVQLVNWTFYEYMIVYCVVESIFTILVYVFAAYVSGGIKPLVSGKMLKTILAFSIPLGLASVVGTLNAELDKLLISNFFTGDQFGVYSNAAKDLPVTMIASAFTAVLLPQFARLLKHDRVDEAVNLWGVANRMTYIVISILAFGCITFAPQVMTILYSEKYVGGATVFALYSAHLLLRTTYYGIILNSKGKSKFIFGCSIAALVTNVVLNFSFFYLFKALGWDTFISPAIATVASTVIMCIVQLTATCRLVKVSFCKIFPWKKLGLITLINIAFSVIFYLIAKFAPIDMLFSSIKIGKRSLNGECIEALILGIIWALLYFAVMMKPLKKLWKQLKTPVDIPEAEIEVKK